MLNCFGHVERMDNNRLVTKILEVKTEKKRKRGSQQI